MLRLNKKIIIWFAVFLAVFAVASAASEETVGARSGPPNDWLSYAKFIFPFALSTAAVLSVIMLIIAGLEMMTASEGMRSDAKEKIQNALFGLAVALGIYLILNTINPALLNLRIDTAGLRVNVEQGSDSAPANRTPIGSNSENKGQACPPDQKVNFCRTNERCQLDEKFKTYTCTGGVTPADGSGVKSTYFCAEARGLFRTDYSNCTEEARGTPDSSANCLSAGLKCGGGQFCCRRDGLVSE